MSGTLSWLAGTPFSLLLFRQIENGFFAFGEQAQERFVIFKSILKARKNLVELAVIFFDAIEPTLDFGRIRFEFRLIDLDANAAQFFV